MATCFAPVSISGGSRPKTCNLKSMKSSSFGKRLGFANQRKSLQVKTVRKLSVCAEYNDGGKGGAADFFAGFVLGGAVCGTLAYIFASQIRRSLLIEDEYGFERARRPIYYDAGLERTRETLNAKVSQLNNAIDNVSSRLRAGKRAPSVPVETDPEVEATM